MRDQVQLYLRVRCRTVPTLTYGQPTPGMGRLIPGNEMQKGRAVELPSCTYDLRYRKDDKRKWESVGPDAFLALVKL